MIFTFIFFNVIFTDIIILTYILGFLKIMLQLCMNVDKQNYLKIDIIKVNLQYVYIQIKIEKLCLTYKDCCSL